MDIQIVIAVAVVAALAYFFVFKKKADVNNDGQVNVEDVKAVAEKVEVAAEQAVEEVKTVAKKTAAKKK